MLFSTGNLFALLVNLSEARCRLGFSRRIDAAICRPAWKTKTRSQPSEHWVVATRKHKHSSGSFCVAVTRIAIGLADFCCYGRVVRSVDHFAIEQRHQAFQVFDLLMRRRSRGRGPRQQCRLFLPTSSVPILFSRNIWREPQAV